jgi:3-hydroxyisobutyrate dehydrogenase-like beta-hydroxyacid dehydrogenase
METQAIGFIGFGEVGRIFAQAMKSQGADVFYFDIANKKPESWITSLSLSSLIERCDIILSTSSTHVAVDVAREAAQFLTAGKIFADMNSTSASVKNRIAEIIKSSKAHFIEGAILSAVGETGPRAAILVCGEKGEEFSRLMNHLGLVNLKYFSPKIGEASQVKMIRSIFSKGIECLLLEMLMAGRRAGVADYLWKDIVDFMTKNSFERVAENWIKTHPLACERRYHEMVQVVETLGELRLEPLMTRGTLDFFRRSRFLGLEKIFHAKPDSFWEVPNYLEKMFEEEKNAPCPEGAPACAKASAGRLEP